MLADGKLFEDILTKVEQLSPEYRLRLIQQITESLLPFSGHETTSERSTPLKYGKYKGAKMSTLEDFAVAEWHPIEKELDGD